MGVGFDENGLEHQTHRQAQGERESGSGGAAKQLPFVLA